jgi:hypothetical protein
MFKKLILILKQKLTGLQCFKPLITKSLLSLDSSDGGLYRIRRIRIKCLSIYEEYGEFMVVCGAQNRLRIRGKNLCVYVYREDGRGHKTEDILFNNGPKYKVFRTLFSIQYGLELAKKP